VVAVGRDYLAGSNARKLGTCDHKQGYKRGGLDDAVFALLFDRLVEPDAVTGFVTAFSEATNAERGKEVAEREQTQTALAETERKLLGLYDAIADGFRTPRLLQKLEDMEARKTVREAQLSASEPSPVRLHPRLPEMYRKEVTDLATSLQDASIRTRALDGLRA